MRRPRNYPSPYHKRNNAEGFGQMPSSVRSRSTRSALRSAFADLIQRDQVDIPKVADLIARVGICRSTFYAHYSGMDALLADSISRPFAVLADTALPGFVESRLIELLEHFWMNRGLARGILAGPSRRKAADVLVHLIERRLQVAGLWRRGATVVPPHLVAIQMAELLLAPITAWLLGESRCTADVLAFGLRRVSAAALESIKT